MNRRSFIASTPAVAAVGVCAGPAPASSSPFKALLAEWLEVRAELNAYTDGNHDAEQSALFDHLTSLHDKMAEMTPATVEDIACQIVMADDFGDMSMNRWQDALADFAVSLVAPELRRSVEP